VESSAKSRKVLEPPVAPKKSLPTGKQDQGLYLDAISGASSTSKPYVKSSIFTPSKTKKQTSSVGYLDFAPPDSTMAPASYMDLLAGTAASKPTVKSSSYFPSKAT
jgi:hypothetical protein